MNYLSGITRSLKNLITPTALPPSSGVADPGIAQVLTQHIDNSPDDTLKAIRSVISQRQAVTLIHGRAGTGKTTLLKKVIARTNLNHVVVAPTGVAALNAGGQTIHSFFCIPPQMINLDEIRPQPKLQTILRRLDLIVIDEISMVRADLLDAIDQTLRVNRTSDKPFGGVLMLFVGDFLQLPPVVDFDDAGILKLSGYESHFAFGAKCLQDLAPNIIELTTVYRQRDPAFVDLLGKLRVGEDLPEVIQKLNRFCHGPHRPTVVPVTLTATKASADLHNTRGLRALTGPTRTYEGAFTGEFTLRRGKQLPAPEFLDLRVGSRVMLVKNDPDKRWVNGSLASVLGLSEASVHVRLDQDGAEHHVVRESWESIRYEWDRVNRRIVARVIGTYSQIPIISAWAITIHKAQGLTLSDVRVDLGAGAFTDGQTYVALSRAQSLSGLSFEKPLKIGDVRVHPELVQSVKSFVERG